jgi:small subunit ribosomal protein S8
MIITDQIADMLTRIRNGIIVRHETVEMPASKMKIAILKILKDEGFISDFEVIKGKPEKLIRVRLRYGEDNQSMITGLKRVSKPGLRVYAQRSNIPRVYGGVGVAILSTPKGVITGQQARRNGVGGEVLCYVW